MTTPGPDSRQPLTGTWTLALDPANRGREDQWPGGVPAVETRPTSVPGTIQQSFAGRYGVAWYWRSFTPTRRPTGHERALLHFHAVEYLGEVWLNGQYLGSHEGGETPFSLDATDALQPNENLLAVRVLNPTNTPIDDITLRQIPHRNKMLMEDFHPGNGLNYGGIVQPVELLIVPALRITDVFARPNSHSGRIDLTVSLRNDTAGTAMVKLYVSVGSAAVGESLAAMDIAIEVPPGDGHGETTLAIDHHRLWSLEDPYLYRVTVRLEAVGAAGATYYHDQAIRCGFRDFRVVDGYFRLNGKRLFVRSTHTGNHFPLGFIIPDDPDLVRRDLLFAKACGLNMVRFIAGMPLPAQLDCCDEIGLLVYEENLAAWVLGDSPQLGQRFARALREMVLRDRNHPSVVIWGLLNETQDGPTFRHAVGSLPLLREFDQTRAVLLGSGRWDRATRIGSVSNPGSAHWEHVWGSEAPDAPEVPGAGTRVPADAGQPAYVTGAGDAHVYPQVPHSAETERFLRTLGSGTKPVYLSEYGIGSLLDVEHIVKRYQQSPTAPAADDLRVFHAMLDPYLADWERYGLGRVYPFPRDLLRESQRLHSRWRLAGLNLIRANPSLAGYNVTGMLDHGYTGEGLWTLWREWKPGIVDALEDGLAPLRWCLFLSSRHVYAGSEVTVEAVLANEDVLGPGEYPARLRIVGPSGPVWEQHITAQIPTPAQGTDGPLAVPVFTKVVRLEGPAGAYVLAASLDQGGSPAGDRLRFHVSDPHALPEVHEDVTLWGVDDHVAAWLATHGVRGQPWKPEPSAAPQIILVGDLDATAAGDDDWRSLVTCLAAGSTILFLSPHAFQRGDDPVGRLPLAQKGRCHAFSNWLYHREDIAMPHPIFRGLPLPGILDWDYYGPVIPSHVFQGQDMPDDVAALFITTGYASMKEIVPTGYASGLITAAYQFGGGRFLINSLRILEHIGSHPAADRLLLNMIAYAADLTQGSAVPLPDDFEASLDALGYRS